MAGSARKTESQRKLSLSGLFNVIDGVSSCQGWVLIMTINYIEYLDEAFIRPGRADRKVELKRVRNNERIRQLAKDFAARVPEQEFNTAEILSFLLKYRHLSTGVMDNLEEWVIRPVIFHRRVKNSESDG